MQKIRILLVHNPVTALFMAAWYYQNEFGKETDWRTVPVYCHANYLDESYSTNIEYKQKIYEQACQAVFKGVFDEWIECMEQRDLGAYHFIPWEPFGIAEERKIREEEIHDIQVKLARAEIPLNKVREIWYGNGKFDQRFFYLCPKARGLSFEHGHGDIRDAVERGKGLIYIDGKPLRGLPHFFLKPVKKLYVWLRQQTQKRCMYFSEATTNLDQHVSVLRDEIAKANPQLKVGTIKASSIFSISNKIIKNDPCYETFTKLKGNNALVLVSTIQFWTKSKADHMAFFESFDQYLYEKRIDAFDKYGVKNIIFKTHFFHEVYAKEGFSRLKRLSQKYNLLFLTDYSERNYTAEYYLHVIKPVVILGDYSTGFFYSKKLLPNVTTLHFLNSFHDYSMRHFDERFREVEQMKYFYEETNKDFFEKLLPKSLDV